MGKINVAFRLAYQLLAGIGHFLCIRAYAAGFRHHCRNHFPD